MPGYHFLKRMQASDAIAPIFLLSDIPSDGMYLAISIQTPDELVEKLRKALEAFKNTRRYQELLKKYDALSGPGNNQNPPPAPERQCGIANKNSAASHPRTCSQ